MGNSRQAEKMRSNISLTRKHLIFSLYSHGTGEVKFKIFSVSGFTIWSCAERYFNKSKMVLCSTFSTTIILFSAIVEHLLNSIVSHT